MAGDNLTDVTRLLDPSVFGEPQTTRQVVDQALPQSSGNQQTSQALQQLETVTQAETETIQANTQAINQNTTQLGQKSTGSSAASEVGSTIESVLGVGTGLSPLITGIMSLFGGGGGSTENLPSTFLMAPAVHVNAGMSEAAPTQPFAVDYAAGGQPRGGPTGQGSGAQITVQVQAMDSQSFLDHRDDIAQAVRQAMLQSSVLNDVIREV